MAQYGVLVELRIQLAHGLKHQGNADLCATTNAAHPTSFMPRGVRPDMANLHEKARACSRWHRSQKRRTNPRSKIPQSGS